MLTQCASSSEPVGMKIRNWDCPRHQDLKESHRTHRLITSVYYRRCMYYRPLFKFTDSNQQVIVPISRTNQSPTSLSHQSSFFSCNLPLERKGGAREVWWPDSSAAGLRRLCFVINVQKQSVVKRPDIDMINTGGPWKNPSSAWESKAKP